MAITRILESGDALDQTNLLSFGDALNNQADRVLSGFELSDGGGLNVDVGSGVALIAGFRVDSDATITEALTASDVNYVYLEADGTVTVNVSGTQPADTVWLGTVTTDGSSVTALSHDIGIVNADAVFAVKASDETFDGTTLASDADLRFTAGAREVWQIIVSAKIYNGNSGGGGQWGIRTPSGIARMYSVFHPATTQQSVIADLLASTYNHSSASTAGPESANTLGTAGGSNASEVQITAMVVTGDSGGTVAVRWAELVDAASVLTVEAGSYMIARRLPF